MRGTAGYWFKPGWNVVLAAIAAICATSVLFVEERGRTWALAVFCASLIILGLADIARDRLTSGDTDVAARRDAGLGTWLAFISLVILGTAYVLTTIVLASRGLDTGIADTVCFMIVAVAGLAMGPRRRLWWTGVAVGSALGLVIFPALPRDASLAGIDSPLEGSLAEVTWFVDGVHVWVDNPTDPQLEYNNGELVEWTVERKWTSLNDARMKTVTSARSDDASCLDLARMMGEDGLIEAVSWIDGITPSGMGRLFECPAARLSKLRDSLTARLSSRGEELAAKESLEAGARDKAIARSRLAVQIYQRSGYARAVAGGNLLRRGVQRMRAGDAKGAREDLEEAILLIDDDGDRGRAHVALGRALESLGDRSAARNSYSGAVTAAPGTAAARAAERAIRNGPRLSP